jgi:hypothetical protein
MLFVPVHALACRLVRICPGSYDIQLGISIISPAILLHTLSLCCGNFMFLIPCTFLVGSASSLMRPRQGSLFCTMPQWQQFVVHHPALVRMSSLMPSQWESCCRGRDLVIPHAVPEGLFSCPSVLVWICILPGTIIPGGPASSLVPSSRSGSLCPLASSSQH